MQKWYSFFFKRQHFSFQKANQKANTCSYVYKETVYSNNIVNDAKVVFFFKKDNIEENYRSYFITFKRDKKKITQFSTIISQDFNKQREEPINNFKTIVHNYAMNIIKC